jgi:hypothetical protein
MDAWDREQISQSDRPEPGRREQRQRGHRGALLGDRGRDRAAERMSYERDGLESESFDPTDDVIGVGVDRVLARRLRAAEAGQVKSDTRPMCARGESFPPGGGVEQAVEQDKRAALARPAPHPQATPAGDEDVVDFTSGHGIL